MSKSTQIPEWLVEEISDPFIVFPLARALRGLGNLIEENKHELFSYYEDVAPKYRDVGLEQGLEAVSILMGAGFVAAQSILATTFSSVRKLAELDVVQSAGDVSIPTGKRELFQIAAYDRNGVPDILGINALANYFKHSSEWPYDWNTLKGVLEVETARVVSSLGLRPNDPDNMMRGAEVLEFGGRDGFTKLATRVQEWRESIESEIRRRLKQASLLP